MSALKLPAIADRAHEGGMPHELEQPPRSMFQELHAVAAMDTGGDARMQEKTDGCAVNACRSAMVR